jgi:uncharacterized cysteine cluster protein YcgN (CxxCxxCC family)
MRSVQPFWERKKLREMTPAEWESLCDRCGRCCLKKLEDADTGQIAYTDVACKLLDRERCSCTRYAARHALVPDCLAISTRDMRALEWLPTTCAYRKLAAGEPLEWWHPLVSGDPNTVHRAGISVRGRALSERDVAERALATRIVAWVATAPLRQRG